MNVRVLSAVILLAALSAGVSAASQRVSPGPPQLVLAQAGSTTITVVFRSPLDNAGGITAYTATATPLAGTSPIRSVTGPSSPLVITGLTNGVTYRVTLTATSDGGTSVASPASSPVTPAAVVVPALDPTASDLGAGITWILPSSGVDIGAFVGLLRARLGPDGPGARLGSSVFIGIDMPSYTVDTTDRAALRALMATTLTAVDSAIGRGRALGFPVGLSLVTAIRGRVDGVQAAAQAEDVRNLQWYSDAPTAATRGDAPMASGWVTYSQYARKLRRFQEAYVRELGRALAERMIADPTVLVAVTGDGEIEMTYERFPDFSVPVERRAIGDYSPFAIAEFRDWIRGAGAYATGEPLAGLGYGWAARYSGDLTPATDDGGDGYTFNRDFGTSFTSWTLRYYDTQWGASETAGALAGFPSTPVDGGAGLFDAPRQIPFTPGGELAAGDAFWQLWIRFRQEMVYRYNRDFARWLTQGGDAAQGGIPAERFYSAQVPTDVLFGDPPPDTGLRLLTSASPHWTADITPYGGVGVTTYSVNSGGCSSLIPCSNGRVEGAAGPYFLTLPHVGPRVSAFGRWGIVEWNPSDPWSADPARYREDNTLVRRYRPSLLMPYMIPSDHWRILDSGFETGLRELLASIRDPGGWTPTITWATPAPVASGTRLSSAQLNASANVDGTFVYAPALGSLVTGAGAQTLSVTFQPSNPDYAPATATVTLQVDPIPQLGERVTLGGRWVEGDRVFTQADATSGTTKKYLWHGLASGAAQRVFARVRVNTFPHVDSRIGLVIRTGATTGLGYSFVFRSGGRVGFLSDPSTSGTTCVFPWAYAQWYSMSLEVVGQTLVGRVWSDTQTEAQATVCTQSGWSTYTAGSPGLHGGVYGETASFDTFTVDGFVETFNQTPAPPAPAAGVLSSRDLLTLVQAQSQTLGFDYGRFADIMHGTAYRLVCANSPGLCPGHVNGTAALIPGPFYNVGTWSRDFPMTITTLNDVPLMQALTTRFLSAGAGASGRMATLLYHDGTPWYGAGGQGNPLDDDDSNMMVAIAARLSWQTVDQQPYLNNVYAWMRAQTDAEGRYLSTAHGWQDSFYPLGVSGPASRTVSSTMQGLYAVALRALKDLGVAVPQSEVDQAVARYRELTVNGRLRGYAGSDRVIVSSLQGEALSLFIWNEPMLPSATVQATIAAFAEVYDANNQFVGYKVVSEADGSFLPPSAFPVENGGAGTPIGDYQNGATWMIYDALALYAGARHAIPSMRATYVDRLVRRFAAELRAGVGTTPANKSNEFLCTAPQVPGAACGPIGSAVPQRVDYGWNAFIVRLLQSDATIETASCTSGSCGVSVAPASLRFGAVKQGPGGVVTAVTGPQTVTINITGASTGWTATSNRSWVRLSSTSGTGSAQLVVSIADDANVLGAATEAAATITVTVADPGIAVIAVPVRLTINQSGVSFVAPVGQVDTPVQDSTGVVGAIALTGWAIDDVGVADVTVYRACVPGDLPQNCNGTIIPGLSLVLVGEADIVPGARPDVAAAFPGYPAKESAGFGLSVLTNMLPRTEGAFAATGGQGPLTFHVVATDLEGNRRLLSRSYTDVVPVPTRITMANDTITKPFGTIDTPGQGATVSGTVNNFGWVLTPDPGTGVLMPVNGSTVRVFVDGVDVGAAAYNLCRGSVAVGGVVPSGQLCNDDVSSAFRGDGTRFRNLDAGRGAIGLRSVNTVSLTNGLHTISWGVTDSAGRVEGIGSRYINVINGSADQDGEMTRWRDDEMAPRLADARLGQVDVAGASERGTSALRHPGTSIYARTGFDVASAFTPLRSDAAGVAQVRIPELGRVELQVPGVVSGALLVNGEERPLPIGLGIDADNGVVTWALGPGFLGTYELVLRVPQVREVRVAVTVVPAQSLTDTAVRMHIDQASAHCPMAPLAHCPISIDGWALDPASASGSGVGAVHVWARRRSAAGPEFRGAEEPVFLGVATLGVSRPDVAAAHGEAYADAGFTFAGVLPDAGEWEVTAYVWLSRTGRFEDARSAVIHVR